VVVWVADEVVVALLGRACGLSYVEAARDAETLERDGVRILLASPSTLIRTKDTQRPQDALDRAFPRTSSPPGPPPLTDVASRL
jgi:hypothetical protein